MRTHSIPDRIRAAVAAFRDPSPEATITVDVPEGVVHRAADDLADSLADDFEQAARSLRHRHRPGRPTDHEYDGPMPQDVAADVSDRVTDAVDEIPDGALVQSLRIDAPNRLVVEYVEPDYEDFRDDMREGADE